MMAKSAAMLEAKCLSWVRELSASVHLPIQQSAVMPSEPGAATLQYSLVADFSLLPTDYFRASLLPPLVEWR
jgi:hypothetical protein